MTFTLHFYHIILGGRGSRNCCTIKVVYLLLINSQTGAFTWIDTIETAPFFWINILIEKNKDSLNIWIIQKIFSLFTKQAFCLFDSQYFTFLWTIQKMLFFLLICFLILDRQPTRLDKLISHFAAVEWVHSFSIGFNSYRYMYWLMSTGYTNIYAYVPQAIYHFVTFL